MRTLNNEARDTALKKCTSRVLKRSSDNFSTLYVLVRIKKWNNDWKIDWLDHLRALEMTIGGCCCCWLWCGQKKNNLIKQMLTVAKEKWSMIFNVFVWAALLISVRQRKGPTTSQVSVKFDEKVGQTSLLWFESRFFPVTFELSLFMVALLWLILFCI